MGNHPIYDNTDYGRYRRCMENLGSADLEMSLAAAELEKGHGVSTVDYYKSALKNYRTALTFAGEDERFDPIGSGEKYGSLKIRDYICLKVDRCERELSRLESKIRQEEHKNKK